MYVDRTPFRVWKAFIDGAVRLVANHSASFGYLLSPAVHENAYHHTAADPPIAHMSRRQVEAESSSNNKQGARLKRDPFSFSVRHWRMTDQRIRMFDGYAEAVMREAGVTILDAYWPSKAWPKVREGAVRELPYMRGVAGFEKHGKDARHHSGEANLALVAELVERLAFSS